MVGICLIVVDEISLAITLVNSLLLNTFKHRIFHPKISIENIHEILNDILKNTVDRQISICQLS
jgi:hypothetical protein